MDDHPLCFRCGTCCIAPDISTLGKPIGVACPHLRDDRHCANYAERPPVCRNFHPDTLCITLQQLPPEERVRHFLAFYDLLGEISKG